MPFLLIQCAVLACNFANAPMACRVSCFALPSSHLPNKTKLITTLALSKYKCCMSWSAWLSHNQSDKIQAAEVPKTTNKSILPLSAFTEAHAPL